MRIIQNIKVPSAWNDFKIAGKSARSILAEDLDNRKIRARRSLEFERNSNMKHRLWLTQSRYPMWKLNRTQCRDAINRPLVKDALVPTKNINITIGDPIVAKASSRTTMEYITRSSLRNDRSVLSFSFHPFSKPKSSVHGAAARTDRKVGAENIRCAKSKSW